MHYCRQRQFTSWLIGAFVSGSEGGRGEDTFLGVLVGEGEGVCRPFSPPLTYFKPKDMIFQTICKTQPLKETYLGLQSTSLLVGTLRNACNSLFPHC